MAYKVIISPRAQKEIENAIDYYSLYSNDAPRNFIAALKNNYATLAKDPILRIRYKHIRAIKINRFPYLLYFEIIETQNIVKVLSCFHNKRNPDTRPTY